MRINLSELTIQGFQSFVQEQSIELDGLKAGLYFVSGENRVEPRLGANGAGKSALFNAICWLLFGKTSNKVKAGDVVNWKNEKLCYVSATINNEVLKRTQSPNRLELNGKIITQEQLEAKYNINFESFLYSVFVAQKASQFFDLSPSNKLEIFSSIMKEELSKWEKRSDAAKDLATVSTFCMNTAVSNLAGIKGRIQGLESLDFGQQSKEWKENNIQLIEKYKNKKIGYEKDLKEKNKSLLETEEQIKEFEEIELELRLEVEAGKELLEALDENVQELIAETSQHKIITERNQKELAKFEGMKDSCPYCGQKVPEKFLKDSIKKLKAEIKKETDLTDGLMAELQSKRSELSKHKDAYEQSISLLEEAVSQYSEAKAFKKSIKAEQETLTAYIATLKQEIKAVQDLSNPFEETLTKTLEDLVFLRRRLVQVDRERVEWENQTNIYSYWKTGFKNIKLLVIKEALKEFEIYINNHLQQLGLYNWEVILDIERDTKKGTVAKGFNVFVKSPFNEKPVPFESWSGGESQRLLIAGTMGLIDFIHNRKGTDWNIECWDEPTAWLSEEGIEDLVLALRDRSKTLKKSLFLIDHKSLNTRGEFAGVITVVKEETGSIITYEN